MIPEVLAGIDWSAASQFAGVLLTIIVTIFGAYISLRDRVTKLEVKADANSKDINEAFEKIRKETGDNK